MRKLTKRQDNRRARLKGRKYVQSVKDNPCMDCGVKYHYSAMQFDHVRGKKRMDVAKMVRDRYSIDILKKEIAKCDLVCANCHAYRTWFRQNSEVLDGE